MRHLHTVKIVCSNHTTATKFSRSVNFLTLLIIVNEILPISKFCCGGRIVMQESAKLFYAGAIPVRNSISGQWHSWLAHSPDKTEVDGSNPSCPTSLEGIAERICRCLLNR